MRESLKFVALVLFVLLLSPQELCAQDAASPVSDFDPDLVVAKVADTEFTLGYLYSVVLEREMYVSTPLEDAKRRQDLLVGLIDAKLIETEAREISLKNRYGALARARRAEIVTAINIFVAEVVSSRLTLDSATIDTFYNNHITRYSVPTDQRRARVISVWKEGHGPTGARSSDQDSLYKGWYPEDKIDSLYTRLCEGEAFEELAIRYSEDGASRGKMGDLGWVTWQSMGAGKFADILKSQPVHMISKPLETDVAWHILQVTAERSAGPVPLGPEVMGDILSNLAEQQQTIIMRGLSDSLLAVAQIDWNEDAAQLPHDQLKRDMILVIVNGRDTVFGEEYLQDKEKWQDRYTHAPPEPDRREIILREDYIRFACWRDYLRELGFIERPEVVAEKNRILQFEREAIVHKRIDSTMVIDPDSSMIQKYYRDSIHLYGTGPGDLRLAWNSIKAKLISDERARTYDHWRRAAAARYGLKRYEDRLALLPFIPRKPKK